MAGVADSEILTVIKVLSRLEDLTIDEQWPWTIDLPRRLPTGEQVKFRVNKCPRSY